MKVSQTGVNFVKGFEGFRGSVYNDMVGVATLGYGMTGSAIKGLTNITEMVASNMLEDLINNKYGDPISKDLDRLGVKLNQNQFDAIVSMAYNVGVAGLLGSTLYSDIVSGVRDKNTITKDFAMWCKAGGVTVNGLLRRRNEEASMFLKATNNVILTSRPVVSKNNSTGNEFIKRLQRELNKQCNSNLIVDGYIGPKTLNACPTVKITARGNITKLLQEKLGVSADGIFGNATLNAVKNFQKRNGLSSDGIVGDATWAKLLK